MKKVVRVLLVFVILALMMNVVFAVSSNLDMAYGRAPNTSIIRNIVALVQILLIGASILLFGISLCIFVVKLIKVQKKKSETKHEEKGTDDIIAERKQIIKKFVTKVIVSVVLFLLSIGIGIVYFEIEVLMYDEGIKKPIIYLYPEEETSVSVTLGNPQNITCSYPKYIDGWNVMAKPNGDLVDLDTGRNLYALYWEGESIGFKKDLKEGFCVKGEDSASFLEEKLAILGLTDREAEEFIVYWLPKLEANQYNLIRFQTMEEINRYMPLEITPTPDTIIRVMMEWKGSNKYIELTEQELVTPERTGFVAVEWGGTEIH